MFLYRGYCDMRRQMDGLSTMVREEFLREPEAGDLFVFRNRRGDFLKILFYDNLGSCLLAKRLFKGTFRVALSAKDESAALELSRAELAALLSKAENSERGSRRFGSAKRCFGARASWTRLPTGTEEQPPQGNRVALVDGFSLHANVRVKASDRKGLEQLIRYGARPAFAHDRLAMAADQVTYRLRKPTPSGGSSITMSGPEFLRRLATLIPPPRWNLVRYHGVFAPNSKLRAAIVPAVAVEPVTDNRTGCHAYREKWAKLLKRVFEFDVTKCSQCGGRLTVVAEITDPPVIKRILDHLGLQG